MLVIFKVVNPFILVFLAIFQFVGVQARVAEWTLTFTFVEVLARDFLNSLFVLFNELLLVMSIVVVLVRWYHEVACLTADRACPKVVFGGALVIGCSPGTNAFEAETMSAAIENAELLACRQNHFHTYLALMVVSLVIGERLAIFFDSVGIGTFQSVSASSTRKVHTHFWSIPLLELALQEFFNQRVIFVVRVPFSEFLLTWLETFWTRPYCLHCAKFLSCDWVYNHFLANLSFLSLIVLLKVVWIVVLLALELLVWSGHGTHLHCKVLDVLHHCGCVWVISTEHALQVLRVHCQLL